MDTENKEKNTEELDLWDLLKTIWNACYSAIGKFLLYLLRKSLWIISFMVLGIAFCIFLSSTAKKYYSSTVQMRSNVNSSLIISQIDVLNDLIKAGKYEELALALQLPVEVTKEVKSIKGLYAVDANKDGYPDYADVNEEVKKNPRDTTIKKLDEYLYLNLEVYSDVVFPNVAKTLKSYIKKNEFLGRENDIIRAQGEALLIELKKQVSLLDSFQKVEYFDKTRSGYSSQQLFMLGDKSQTLYHGDYISLYNQQLEKERELELYNEIVTIIQDFPPLSTPANPLMSYLKKYVWKFMLLGFVCAILWDNRKFILSNAFQKKTPA